MFFFVFEGKKVFVGSFSPHPPLTLQLGLRPQAPGTLQLKLKLTDSRELLVNVSESGLKKMSQLRVNFFFYYF